MQRDPASSAPKSQKQIVIAILLSIGLAVALATQPDQSKSDSSQPPANTEPLAITSIALQSAESADSVANDSSLFVVKDLPRRSIQIAKQHDLFSATSRRRRLLQPELPIEDVQVQAIYGNHQSPQHAALNGTEILRTGQRLSDGRTVSNVSTQGVTITSAPH
ncbi:hypothetical protein [Planctomycetes bacterium K23_9]|uniref:Uncharacterized protein n=1 Tax=Stieleria marina TaxID=1930275 RepID=A0A517NSC4_9BACT|nr:hypothetical protein K239x_19580 [Planctomycetes bacterium K23_9]